MRTVDQYLGLIPPANAAKPKFTATVAASVLPLVGMQAALREMAVTDFDLDTAIGFQLDAVGVRIGRSRLLPYPLQGIFFALDDPARGLDKGIWKGPYSPGVGQTSLDDDTYRRLLRAIVIANRSDGSIGVLQSVLDAYFQNPTTFVFIEDNGLAISNGFFALDTPQRGLDQGQWALAGEAIDKTPADMSMAVVVAGKLPDLIDLGLLAQHALPVKPEGVSLDYRVTSVDGAAVFGLDMNNQYVGGLDVGAWGVGPGFIAANVIPVAA